METTSLTPAPDRSREILLRMKDDPLLFLKVLWPEVRIYDKQVQIVESVRDNYITVVPAANKMGKDFIAGFISLWYFLVHREVRVVTTSVKDDHLRVLWGEIGRFIDTARTDTPLGPLKAKEGGPLITNHRDVSKIRSDRSVCKISYLRGMVSEKGEGMAGHHAEAALGVTDEASGISDETFDQMETWAKRILVIGNPLPCQNKFREWVKQGDVLAED